MKDENKQKLLSILKDKRVAESYYATYVANVVFLCDVENFGVDRILAFSKEERKFAIIKDALMMNSKECITKHEIIRILFSFSESNEKMTCIFRAYELAGRELVDLVVAAGDEDLMGNVLLGWSLDIL